MIREATLDPILTALFDHWNGRRCGRAMPDRRDIDPTEMPPAVLPHVLLCDLFGAAERVRFRLIGTAIVERVGNDHTGLFIDEVMTGQHLDYVLALHREVYRRRVPVYTESVFDWGRPVTTRRVFLPLTHGGEEPRIMLIGMVFDAGEKVTAKPLLSNMVRRELRRVVLAEA